MATETKPASARQLGVARDVVIWPQSVGGGMRCWGGAVIPYDDPLLDCDGVSQVHLLRPAPAGSVATPHDNPRAAARYRELGYDGVPYADPKAAPAGGGKGTSGKSTATAAAPEPGKG